MIIPFLTCCTGCEKNEDDTIVVNKSDETFAPSKVRPVLEKQQKELTEKGYMKNLIHQECIF